ncbi:MAG: ATP-dependent DNA helicase [Beutenbergiaceae bacterium]
MPLWGVTDLSEASSPPESADQSEDSSSAEFATAVVAALDAVVDAMGGTQREGQRMMARSVATALTGTTPALVQAGTGTGKSLAYLVPTLMRAVLAGERAVISTATLALQRQVIGQDVPLVEAELSQRMPRQAQVALLKGWHNYLCAHKLAGGYPDEEPGLFELDLPAAGREEHPLPQDDSLGAQVVRVRAWAKQTSTGDRDDLLPGVSDRAWRQVSVTARECLGVTCPMRTECFPEAARAAARAADVVVTNHAMLGVAAAGTATVLPEFDLLVVDEAHELAARVSAQASVDLSVATVERVARMGRRQGGTATEALDDAIDLMRSVLGTAPTGRWGDGLPPEVEGVIRAVADASRQLISALKPEPGTKPSGDGSGGVVVARSAALELFEIAERLLGDRVGNGQDVVWLSRGREDADPPRIHVAPLDVSDPIASVLLSDRAAVLTSATLTLGGGFEPTARAVGLSRGEFQGVEVDSPFDYRRQGILYVARHLPKPGRDGTDPAVLDEIAELIESAGGRTLGLFSSRRGAVAAAQAMRERLDLPILVQGEESIAALVAQFAAEPQLSLFGTLSLWQGVDVPGEACQLVLIDRIPFPRPDDPVMSARSDAVARRGGNGFMEVSAAHAALLLAQGAGRLIRRISDRGVVAILDPRVSTARYSSYLTRSLPPLWPTTDPAVVRGALRRLAGEN